MSTDIGAVQSTSREARRVPRQAATVRLCRFGSYLFLALSAVLFVLGLTLTTRVGAVLSLGGEQDLLLDASSKSFGEARARSEFTVTFTLTNPSRQALKVVGANFVCGPQGCLSADNLPLEIPPREKRELTVRVKTVNPGEFQEQMTLYTDCVSKHEVVIKVKGRVVG